MIFKLPPSSEYEIPNNLDFKFTEHCFGNHWYLQWKENHWEGNNCQGKINSKVINKCNLPADETWDHYHVSHIMIKKELNKNFITPQKNDPNLMYSLVQNAIDRYREGTDNDTIKIYINI